MKKIYTYFFLYLVIIFPIDLLNAQVLLNEVSPDAGMSDGVNDGLVEIINAGSVPVDVGCYVISNGEWAVTIPAGTSITAGDVFLIACSASPSATPAEGLTCDRCDFAGMPLDLDVCSCTDCFTGNAITLDNENTTDGDQVALFDASGTLLDGVHWNGGSSNIGGSDVELPTTMNTLPSNGGSCALVAVNLPASTDAVWTPLDTYLNGCNTSYSRNIGTATTGTAAVGDWVTNDHPNPGEQNDSPAFNFSISATELCAPGTVTVTVEVYNYQNVQPSQTDINGKYGSYIQDENGIILDWTTQNSNGGTTTLTYTTGTLAAGTYTLVAQWDDYTEGCCGSTSPTSNNECYERMEYTVKVAEPMALIGNNNISCPVDFAAGQIDLGSLISGGLDVTYELFDNGVSLGTSSNGVFTILDTYTGPITATATNGLTSCGAETINFSIRNNCRLLPPCPLITSSNFLANETSCGSTGGFSTSSCPLDPGTIAFLLYNADGNEEFAFLVLGDIDGGTVINFTDQGWNGTALTTNEGTADWTAPAGGLSAGTVVTIEGTTTSIGAVTSNTIALSGSGDQILAYCGSSANPTFIAAINNEGAGVWQTSIGTSSHSLLPPGLTNGTHAVALTEMDNISFDCDGETVVGDPATVLQNINLLGNWTGGSNSTVQPLASCTYDIITSPPAICTVCPSDIISLSVDGTDLPEGGNIDWYRSTTPNFNPYQGEGSLIGSSPIPPTTGCAAVPAVSVTAYDFIIQDLSDQGQEIDATGVWGGTGSDYGGIGLANGPTPATGEVYIAQILYDPSAAPTGCGDGTAWGSSNAEIIELRGEPMMDIGCWVMSDGDGAITFPEGTLIPADGVFVLGSGCTVSPYPSAEVDLTVTSDLMSGLSMVFANTGDELILLNPLGNIESAISYNNGAAETTPATLGLGLNTPPIDAFTYTIETEDCNNGPYYVKGIISPHPDIASCLNSDASAFTKEFEYDVICPELMLSGTVTSCTSPVSINLEFLNGTDGADYNITLLETVNGTTAIFNLTAVAVPGTEILTITSTGEYEIQSFEEVGACSGSASGTASVAIAEPVTFSMSQANGDICQGGNYEVIFNFPEAVLPVEFTYTHDANPINTIIASSETHVLQTSMLGTYTIDSAVDGIGCPISVAGAETLVAPASCMSTLCGTVWYDGYSNDPSGVSDNNGLYDAGESFAPGIIVNLYTTTGIFVGTDTTSTTGDYCFNALGANDYYVEFVYAGMAVGSPQVGAGVGDDGSDADPSTGANGPDGVPFTLDDLQGGQTGLIAVDGVGDFLDIDAGLFGEDPLLPMELISFSAEKRGEHVALNWETATESNTDYFSIERSRDGVDFTPIGRLVAAGSSSANISYDFMDVWPQLGINYYRLRLYDKDGEISVSKVEAVIFKGEKFDMVLSPNPTRDALNINFTQEIIEETSIEVFSVTGVQQGVITIPKGVFSTRINVGHLPNGAYFIRVVNRNNQLTQQFMKVN